VKGRRKKLLFPLPSGTMYIHISDQGGHFLLPFDGGPTMKWSTVEVYITGALGCPWDGPEWMSMGRRGSATV
jgi:hypothetical protein